MSTGIDAIVVASPETIDARKWQKIPKNNDGLETCNFHGQYGPLRKAQQFILSQFQLLFSQVAIFNN